MQTLPVAGLRSLLARPLIDQALVNGTSAGSMTATAGGRFVEALIKSIGGSCKAWVDCVPPRAVHETDLLLLLCCLLLLAGVIGASEIGDKTFFIAAVMAMRNSRWTVSVVGISTHGAATEVVSNYIP